jgi:Trk K+ transport system NAD-binding subunit
MNYGHVMAVAWQRPPAPPVLFPSPDITVTTGDWVTLIGPEAEVRAFTRSQARHHQMPLPPAPRRPFHRRAATVFRNLDRILYITLALLLLLILVGGDIYAEDRHVPLIDALTAMVGLVSTTAFGATTDPNDPLWFKLFILGVTIAGTVALAVIYAFVTNYVVSIKLTGLLGQQQVTMRNHIVLCGLGTVGYRVMTGLAGHKEAVALLERSDTNRFLPLVRSLPGAQVVIGDAQLRESLELVNITAARCIVVATSDDIANIQTALNARQLNPRIRVILRLFDQRMAEQVGEIFGFDVALSPSALAAPAFVAAAATGAIVHEFRVDHTELVIARVVVPPAGAAAGRTLGGLLTGLPAAVLYYATPGSRPHYRPLPTRLLTPGDTLLLIASEPTLREVMRRLGGIKREAS